MVRLPRVPRWTQWAFPQMEWRVEKPGVLLTFDDGPHPEITPWVQEQLRAHKQKSTFFLVGENAQKHPELVEDLKTEGHQIGNHTMNHVCGFKTPVGEYLENVDAAAVHTSDRLFRPPYGRVTKREMDGLILRNYRIMMWEVLSYDFDQNLSGEDCLVMLKKHTNPGSIVVFHDSEKAWPRLKTCLPEYLKWLAVNPKFQTKNDL
ncbi:MAG: polysaccharide deacetylase family protein [Cryomorphaceae bacterium]|nr:polysaccharide deacetylase family protein [Cryomorphaceae bacterium]